MRFVVELIITDFRTNCKRNFLRKEVSVELINSISYERYANIRDAENLTDYRVADLAGIPRSTFSDWKGGRSKPKVEKLFKICRVLNVTLDDLIFAEEATNV